MNVKKLTPKNFEKGILFLANNDPDLGAIVTSLGTPPLWTRNPGFPTLVHIVLEQQVSLASAKAAFDRLNEALPIFIPSEFLLLDDMKLKRIGFSRQKSRYCRNIALAIDNKSLLMNDFENMTDECVRDELQKIKGIGRWTADIYLLMALRRPDIWPVGDLALASAVQDVKRLKTRPSPEKLDILNRTWKPWRAVAARILWHHYLSN
jgi:DNA-3-methyladenine glycosylase II